MSTTRSEPFISSDIVRYALSIDYIDSTRGTKGLFRYMVKGGYTMHSRPYLP